MRVGQRIADVGCDGHGMGAGQAALALDHERHIRAIDVFHDDVEQAARGLPEVIHSHNAWMAELGHGLRLVFEALSEVVLPVVQLCRQDFDGDEAIQRGLPCQIHRTHATPAQTAQDFVVREMRGHLLWQRHSGLLGLDWLLWRRAHGLGEKASRA